MGCHLKNRQQIQEPLLYLPIILPLLIRVNIIQLVLHYRLYIEGLINGKSNQLGSDKREEFMGVEEG